MYEITDYLTETGRDPLKEWLASLANRQARARVLVRLQRMAAGNFGDYKLISDGCMNYESTMGRAIACITPELA
jgi:putative component of toxin-antitoxin plasmid stabilization module